MQVFKSRVVLQLEEGIARPQTLIDFISEPISFACWRLPAHHAARWENNIGEGLL